MQSNQIDEIDERES